MSRNLRIFAPLFVAGALILPSSAAAAPTREEFIDRADTICAKAKPSVNRKLDRAGQLINRKHDVPQALRLLNSALRRWRAMIADLRELETPPDDDVIVYNWLFYEHEQVDHVQLAVRQLRKRNFFGAQLSLDRAERKGDRAERIVGGWDFKECT